jgi:hypothetical protein
VAGGRGSDDLPSPPTLSSVSGRVDYLGFVYNLADATYDLVAINKGFAPITGS